MASILELRSRIKSVNSTKKITKAQELIATSRITKLRFASPRPSRMPRRSRRYSPNWRVRLLRSITRCSTSVRSPSGQRSSLSPVTAACVVATTPTSSSRQKSSWLSSAARARSRSCTCSVPGLGYYTFRGRDIGAAWTGFSQDPGYSDAAKASRHLVELFMAGSGNQVAAPNGEGTIEASTNSISSTPASCRC